MTPIGTLQHRLAIEAPEETPDGVGGVVRTWKWIDEVWAAIDPVSARDAVAADRRLGVLTHRVFVRRRDGLTVNHRFRDGNRIFSIRAVRDPDARGRFLECLVEEERP